MGKKVLSAILTLKDKDFSSNMKKASGGVSDFDRKVKRSKNQLTQFRKNVTSSFSSVAKSAVGLAAAYIGISKGMAFANEGVELAKKQIEAETKLAAVMKNTKGVTDSHIQSIKEYASVQQNLGVIGDEVQLSGVQQLATYQLQADTLKKLMPGMNDLLAQQKGLNATQEDATSVGNMIGKVMMGQVGALSRAGINFSKAQEEVLKFGNEQQKAAMLAEVLQQNVGGVNAAMADTDAGKVQQMTNAWGDYKEEVGKKILPLQARFAGWFVKKIPGIQSAVLNFIDKGVGAFDKAKPVIGSLFDKLKPGIAWIKDIGFPGVVSVVSDLYEKAKPIIGWIKDTGLPGLKDGISFVADKAKELYNFVSTNWEKFQPIIMGIAGAITTYKLGVIAISAVTKTWTLITAGMTLAQGLLNGAIAISPLGWVAMAIGAVIAVGVLLYKNWDTVKEKALGLWEGLKGAWSGISQGFSNMWANLKESSRIGVNFIIDGINRIINGFNNFASFKVPDWVPGIGGKGFEMNIPSIPKFALGTSYFTGGLAQINERGGEIVDLPNGSRVYPHDKSVQMAKNESKGNIININIQGYNKSTNEIIGELVPALKLALSNI